MPPGEVYLNGGVQRSRRVGLGVAAIGGGAVGAAVMGVLALGAAPADAPAIERRAPVTQLVTPSSQPVVVPPRRPGP
jgi:hypothetical protein